MTRWFLILMSALALTGCGYNDFQRLDEQTKSDWSEVLAATQANPNELPDAPV